MRHFCRVAAAVVVLGWLVGALGAEDLLIGDMQRLIRQRVGIPGLTSGDAVWLYGHTLRFHPVGEEPEFFAPGYGIIRGEHDPETGGLIMHGKWYVRHGSPQGERKVVIRWVHVAPGVDRFKVDDGPWDTYVDRDVAGAVYEGQEVRPVQPRIKKAPKPPTGPDRPGGR